MYQEAHEGAQLAVRETLVRTRTRYIALVSALVRREVSLRSIRQNGTGRGRVTDRSSSHSEDLELAHGMHTGPADRTQGMGWPLRMFQEEGLYFVTSCWTTRCW